MTLYDLKYPGSPQARRQLFIEKKGVCPIDVPAGTPPQALRFTAVYRHLGTLLTPDGTLAQEVAAREASAMSAFRPLSRKLFADDRVDRTSEHAPKSACHYVSAPVQK